MPVCSKRPAHLLQQARPSSSTEDNAAQRKDLGRCLFNGCLFFFSPLKYEVNEVKVRLASVKNLHPKASQKRIIKYLRFLFYSTSLWKYPFVLSAATQPLGFPTVYASITLLRLM